MSFANPAGQLQWNEKKRPLPSDALVPIVREHVGNRLLLGVSGKDSIAAWLYLRENGFEIIPYMMWTVPGGLSFEREARAYYEDFFGVPIYFLPHPNFYKFWGRGDYQSPVSIGRQRGVNLTPIDYYMLEDALAKRHGLGEFYLCAIGYRAADDPGRRRMINNMGAIYTSGKRHYYYAIWDWTIARVMEIIRRYGVKLSRSYAMFGCTFDEYGWNDLVILQHESPEDYRLLREFYPLIGTKVLRFFMVK